VENSIWRRLWICLKTDYRVNEFGNVSSLNSYGKRFIRKKKGKAVPLQAWSGPEGSRKLRFPDYMTMAQDGG
jgi:hypothetical protein